MSSRLKLFKHPSNNNEMFLLEIENQKLTLHKSKDAGNNWSHKVSRNLTGTTQNTVDAVISESAGIVYIEAVISSGVSDVETVIFNGTTMVVGSANATYSTGDYAQIVAGSSNRFVALIR